MVPALSQKPQTTEVHVIKMLSQGAPMMDVLNELCNFIDARSPEAIPTVLLVDDSGTHLKLAAGPKISALWSKSFHGLKVPIHNKLENANRASGKSLSISDMRSDPSFAACWNLALSQGVQAAWSLPILSRDGKVLGSLILFCPTSDEPGEREKELMELSVHMAAIAIESQSNEEELREFSGQLYKSQDEERRRIARELHDSTGQKVAALAMSLSRVKNTIAPQTEEVDEILEESIGLTREISDELRTLSYLLHPPFLEECGLTTAIQWYARGINERDGLHVEVEIPEDMLRLTEEAELAIFRVVQASLTNVHLHSRAKKARVKVEATLDGAIVAVSDDGQGIPDGVLDHSSKTRTIGIGITGMRERMKRLGGRLDIETNHNGTKVKASVPCRHFRTIAATAVRAAC
ncbi:MAG TPA: GAF domain-containing sensor histidine kinase [Candidatus Saccharimonadales bacterium]|nr:GAF domain-containing sensor histidine kinase [Candidatus Saccharimonadales bacterium]